MNFKMIFIGLLIFHSFSSSFQNAELDVLGELEYCSEQISRTLTEIQGQDKMPRQIATNSKTWNLESPTGNNPWWTVGFWPGILWYNFENTQAKSDSDNALHYTTLLGHIADKPAPDHDQGFKIECSYGNAYRLTGESSQTYRDVLIKTAEGLTELFSPIVGTIWSWPGRTEWSYNTIIDNMINLELLFHAAKLTTNNTQKEKFYNDAVSHASTTMKNHFRPDYSSYHVAVYDKNDGHFIKGVTQQGYSDSSQWARGQAWAIYGFTMVYRETGDITFLRFAEKITDYYLKRLHEHEDTWVPYWDFDDPAVVQKTAPRDSSAGAIVASALLELSQLEDDAAKRDEYMAAARATLAELASGSYKTGTESGKHSFLVHATGNKPANSEVDVALAYADYYYIEALTRLRRLTGA